MKRSMNVANETGQEYGVVTYDLAVALKAYSIQALDAPLFDKLLIMLGNFHLEMAFYGAIGTFINESGAEYLLTESGILAEGSLMGFIRGNITIDVPEFMIFLHSSWKGNCMKASSQPSLLNVKMPLMTSSPVFHRIGVCKFTTSRPVRSFRNICMSTIYILLEQ